MTTILLATCAALALAWLNAHGRHRDVRRELGETVAQLDASEAERLRLEAAYRRYRAEAPRRRGQDMPGRVQ